MQTNEVVIVAGVRTPIGRVGGALAAVRPDDLLATVMRGVVERAAIDPQGIDEVYAGCANQAGEDNRNVARMATLLAGFPDSVPAVTLNRLCASGLEAVNQAARCIAVGEAQLCVAGGVESMSRAPWVLPKPEGAYPVGSPPVYDTTLGWRFPNPQLAARFPLLSMGQTAENIAQELGITRAEQDAFALESHRRAVAALNAGYFAAEVLPVSVPQRRGAAHIVDVDEAVRCKRSAHGFELDTDMERLAQLAPAFREQGSVTPGNSSGLNDGAAALVLMSAVRAQELGLRPLARWLGAASAGVDPSVMGYGPVPATQQLLARQQLTVQDIGLVELNEAFAAQALGVMRKLGLRHEITNVNGGAIALGHPLGCSGARILVTLLHEMQRRAPQQARPYYGLATLCVGVGQGVSTLVEWLA